MSEKAPYHIVVAVDLTEMTDTVLAAARDQAETHHGSLLHAVCVIDDTQDVLGRNIDSQGELDQLARAVRARVAASLSLGETEFRVHTRAGRPAEQINAVAAELQADLIVLGRHSQSRVSPLFLGSVPSRLLAHARCNVLVIQPRAYDADDQGPSSS